MRVCVCERVSVCNSFAQKNLMLMNNGIAPYDQNAALIPRFALKVHIIKKSGEEMAGSTGQI